MDNRLNIAFLWHMHQPIYKDPISGEYTMPWVLLHGTKDYYDMAAILDEFPDVHQTFNLVPSLMAQINEYASNTAVDSYVKLSKKPVQELTKEDKGFIIQYFFQANWDYMIRPVQRYADLLKKRGAVITKEEVESSLRYFKDQDYLDLQILFNLVWIDPVIRDKDPALSALYARGGKYTEADKKKLFGKQTEIIGSILPKYSELMARGIIEVSTTPFYHPIMPLLCDSFSSKEAMPGVMLPKERFQHPEDASMQLKKGLSLYKETFGKMPEGIWPSEGSVSMEMLPIIASQGIKWIATDEEILTNSLKRPLRRDSRGNCSDPFLYRPYSIEVGGAKVSIIFRDHVLSDLIGFDYSKMGAEEAAGDMVARLVHIHGMLENPSSHIVGVILDGENAWEHFPNDGRDFLAALYSRLSNHPKLKCVTVSEYLNAEPQREPLEWLYPGSWIGHNFKIWIGHVEDNTAWDYIAEARAALVNYSKALKPEELDAKKKALDEAWDALYAAEGSDWFWWYGEEHTSLSDEHFDSLFRKYIKKVYLAMDVEPPEYLEFPISSEVKGYVPPIQPTAFIKPSIDGIVSNYFEWLSAGRLERQYYGSAMHRDIQGGGLIEGISYGFSQDSLFFRFDYFPKIAPYEKEWGFTVNFLHPRPLKLTATVKGKSAKAVIFEKEPENGKWVEKGAHENMAADAVVEVGIPLEAIGASKGMDIKLFINIDTVEAGVERWPVKGFLVFQIPSEDFLQQDWIV